MNLLALGTSFELALLPITFSLFPSASYYIPRSLLQ